MDFPEGIDLVLLPFREAKKLPLMQKKNSFFTAWIIFYQHVQDVDLMGWKCLAVNIADGYAYIVNLKPADEFSRGAVVARARALANLVG